MAVERTLSIIKPDAVASNVIGQILSIYEQAGLRMVASKMLQLTREQAEAFYDEHRGRPYYDPLIDFMVTGPVLVSVLVGENAIAHHRSLIGSTNPAEAAEGTVRRHFAKNNRENAVHGSDSAASATREIAFFFDDHEIYHS